MFTNIDLNSKGYSAEDSMKFNVASQLSKDRYDASLYQEAAKRTVFRNCMEKLEITDEELPNFNSNFYYNRKDLQASLSECYNTRMELHFGHENAKKHGLYMDFAEMKKEFQNYESWLPYNRLRNQYSQGFDEERVDGIIEKLRAKH